MKKFFGRKKLRKSKSDIPGEGPALEQNGSLNREANQIPPSHSANLQAASSSDGWAVCSSMSEGTERKKFDTQMDKHVMQSITDVKYLLKRSKFTAVGEVNFQRDCLDAHNSVREKHGNPPLSWSQELADLAHSWAIKLAERKRILYPEIPGIGENMVLKAADQQEHLPTGSEIVTEWEAENQFFDYRRPKWHPKCKHFSQIVWRDTVEMGVARQWNTANNCVAIVAFYRPAGNSNAPGASSDDKYY